MDLLSLVEVDDSFGMCVGHDDAFAGKPRSYRIMRSPVGARLDREGRASVLGQSIEP
jgi:hypothetical protein